MKTITLLTTRGNAAMKSTVPVESLGIWFTDAEQVALFNGGTVDTGLAKIQWAFAPKVAV